MVCKCLNVDSEDRYQNAGELLGEVELLMDQMELHDDYDDGEE